MTPTECIFLGAWLFALAAFALAFWKWLWWGRAARRLYDVTQEQQETIGRLWNENRTLREREQCRRVFGTDHVTTDEFGAPVG